MHCSHWPTTQLIQGCFGSFYMYLRFCLQAIVGRDVTHYELINNYYEYNYQHR